MKAVREKGRILILGDQGVNRSATLTVIYILYKGVQHFEKIILNKYLFADGDSDDG